MNNELPKAYDPALIEEKWANFWLDQHLFDVPTPGAPSASTLGAPSSPAVSSQAKVGSQDAHAVNPFVQLLPPPNVTGRLHIGHMLEHTQMDILTRWHRMSGDTAVWVPGTDHAGIATQMMVERQLKSEGKSRTDFSREDFTARVWEWKQEYGSAITDQMKRLGTSVDWSREYFTMDDRLSVAVREAFVRLYEQGLIYRGAYIVNWDPILQTAVSDLEVENEERLGKLYLIRYPLADGTGSVTIATTRPETMLGDTAVAVNPTDERYKHLIGKLLKLPLTQREIPIIADDWANPEFGTGAVKVTPAHDPNDFAIGQRHPEIGSISILDKTAHVDVPGGSPFNGLDRYEARERIIAELQALDLLVEIKDHAMTVPVSQRTSAVIEPRLSLQWFLAVNTQPSTDVSSRPERTGAERPASPESPQTLGAPSSPAASSSAKVGSQNSSAAKNSIAANAIAAVEQGHITFLPDNNRKTYMEWMSNIHDWCLSRQLWWGHRIPAWHCGACGKITVSREPVLACSGCGITDIHQDPDVLDTWFSSGLLPFTVFGWDGSNKPTADLNAFYPTQQLVTGFDILFFWVARMIMLSTHFMLDVPNADGSPRTLADAVPFRNVYIHALVRDADRQKISKTKGNVIDPIEIITKYGTDAVRFTLAAQSSPGTDIAFNEARTEGYRAFANKIWNAARFLQMNLDRAREAGYTITLNPNSVILNGAHSTPTDVSSRPESASFADAAERPAFGTTTDLPDETPLETRWIFSALSAVAAQVERSLRDYRFDEAAQTVYQFFWGEFCDWYLELIKLRLNFDLPNDPDTALAVNALVTVFEAALRLLSPFMPFLTEELWHALYASIGQPSPAKSIALTRYPVAADFPHSDVTLRAMADVQQLIVTIRALRKDLAVPEKESTPIQLRADLRITALAEANADMLARMARVSAVEMLFDAPTGNNARSTPIFDVAVVYERQIDVPAERERLEKEIAKLTKGLEAANKQLGNEGFIARAPAHIIEGLKKQSTETQALYDKATAALAALPNS